MTKMQTVRIALWYLILIPISVARGQVGPIGPSDGYLMLYRLDGTPNRYVLSMSFESREKDKTSFVVIGDTFSVKPDGAMCSVVMSNVYILETSFGRPPSNEVVQIKLRTDAYKWSFPKNTKLVFNNSVAELPNVKIEASAEANTITYEGKDALKQLRRLGLKPPDDIDMEKATGPQKR
jgi:hypothetical protein